MCEQPLYTEENHLMCIYMLTSPSGKHYVGQARDYFDRQRVRNYDYRRWLRIKDDESYSDVERRGSNPRLYLAFLKYGIENFTAEILEENIENREKMDEREIYWMEQYDCLKKGYNVVEGGGMVTNIDPLTGRSTQYGKSKYTHNRTDEKKEYTKEVYFAKHEEYLAKHRAYRKANPDKFKKTQEVRDIENERRRELYKFMHESDLATFGDITPIAGMFRKIFGGGRTRALNFVAPKGKVTEQGCWLAE